MYSLYSLAITFLHCRKGNLTSIVLLVEKVTHSNVLSTRCYTFSLISNTCLLYLCSCPQHSIILRLPCCLEVRQIGLRHLSDLETRRNFKVLKPTISSIMKYLVQQVLYIKYLFSENVPKYIFRY